MNHKTALLPAFAAALFLAVPGEAGAVTFTDGDFATASSQFTGDQFVHIQFPQKADPDTAFVTFGSTPGATGFVKIRLSFDPLEHLGALDLRFFFGAIDNGAVLTLAAVEFFQDVTKKSGGPPDSTGPFNPGLDLSAGGSQAVDLEPAMFGGPFDFATYDGIEIRIDYENSQSTPGEQRALATLNAFGVTTVEQPAAVAEPGALALLGLGVAGLLGTRRRRPERT